MFAHELPDAVVYLLGILWLVWLVKFTTYQRHITTPQVNIMFIEFTNIMFLLKVLRVYYAM